MGLTPDPFRYRLRLVQVGLAGNVSAAAVQLDGACRGNWTITSDTPLPEFLARPNYEFDADLPVIRVDLAGDDYFTQFISGPYWDADLRDGHVRPRLGEPRRHNGEPWTAMRGWWLAPDVYAALAPAAGVVIQRAADHLPGT